MAALFFGSKDGDCINQLEAYRREYGPLSHLDEMRSWFADDFAAEMKRLRLPSMTGQELVESAGCVEEFPVTIEQWIPEVVKFDVESGDGRACVTIKARLMQRVWRREAIDPGQFMYQVESVDVN